VKIHLAMDDNEKIQEGLRMPQSSFPMWASLSSKVEKPVSEGIEDGQRQVDK
jgi:hypothetical protein